MLWRVCCGGTGLAGGEATLSASSSRCCMAFLQGTGPGAGSAPGAPAWTFGRASPGGAYVTNHKVPGTVMKGVQMKQHAEDMKGN